MFVSIDNLFKLVTMEKFLQNKVHQQFRIYSHSGYILKLFLGKCVLFRLGHLPHTSSLWGDDQENVFFFAFSLTPLFQLACLTYSMVMNFCTAYTCPSDPCLYTLKKSDHLRGVSDDGFENEAPLFWIFNPFFFWQKCVSEYFEHMNAMSWSSFTKIKDESLKKKKDVVALLKECNLMYIGYVFGSKKWRWLPWKWIPDFFFALRILHHIYEKHWANLVAFLAVPIFQVRDFLVRWYFETKLVPHSGCDDNCWVYLVRNSPRAGSGKKSCRSGFSHLFVTLLVLIVPFSCSVPSRSCVISFPKRVVWHWWSQTNWIFSWATNSFVEVHKCCLNSKWGMEEEREAKQHQKSFERRVLIFASQFFIWMPSFETLHLHPHNHRFQCLVQRRSRIQKARTLLLRSFLKSLKCINLTFKNLSTLSSIKTTLEWNKRTNNCSRRKRKLGNNETEHKQESEESLKNVEKYLTSVTQKGFLLSHDNFHSLFPTDVNRSPNHLISVGQGSACLWR